MFKDVVLFVCSAFWLLGTLDNAKEGKVFAVFLGVVFTFVTLLAGLS